MSKYSLQITSYSKTASQKYGELVGGEIHFIRDSFEECAQVFEEMKSNQALMINPGAKIVKHHDMSSLKFGFNVKTHNDESYQYTSEDLKETLKQWNLAKRRKSTKQISDFTIYSVEKKF